MTTQSLTRGLSLHGVRAAFADARRSWRENARKRAMINETYRELNALSDRELADLGIARHEVMNVAKGAVLSR